MMGFSAEASYLAAVHYTSVEIADRQQVMNGASDASPKQNRKQQKLVKQIEELSTKEDLTLSEAYKLSKLMEKNIAESDTARSPHKYERKVRKREVNIKTDSLADKRIRFIGQLSEVFLCVRKKYRVISIKKSYPSPKTPFRRMIRLKQQLGKRSFKHS